MDVYAFFHIFAIVNMRLRISFHYLVFIFFGYTVKSGIAGLHGNSFFFNFWRNHHTGFHGDFTNLHFHQVYKCSLLTEFSRTIIFLVVMMSAIIRCVSWNLTVALLCASLTLLMFSVVLYTCWPLGCLLWKNVYLIPIVIHFQIEVRKKMVNSRPEEYSVWKMLWFFIKRWEQQHQNK